MPASPNVLLQQHILKAHTQGQQGFIDNLRAAIPMGTNIEAAFRKEKGGWKGGQRRGGGEGALGGFSYIIFGLVHFNQQNAREEKTLCSLDAFFSCFFSLCFGKHFHLFQSIFLGR